MSSQIPINKPQMSGISKRRRIAPTAIIPARAPPSKRSRLRFGKEASTRYKRNRARVWNVSGYANVLGAYPITKPVSLVVNRLYGLEDASFEDAYLLYGRRRGTHPDGYFDDLAWGDVLDFGTEEWCHGHRYWFVVGDRLQKEKWMLLNLITLSRTLGLGSRRAFPLDLYDSPKDYYHNLIGEDVLSGDYRRLYGLPDTRSIGTVIHLENCWISTEDHWHNRSDAFTKTYDRRMKRVEADMKVILWKSLRHLRVRGYCFPWDCCELIVSFLAVTPITGGYTLCILK